MTMSVKELLIGHLVRPALRAGETMIHLDDLLHGQEEQSTPSTSSILGFQQFADPPRDLGMCLEPFGPIQQVPIVGARGALDLGVPLDRATRMPRELGTGPAVLEDPMAWTNRPPIAGADPPVSFRGMPTDAPAPQGLEQHPVELAVDLLRDDPRVEVGPTGDDR